MKFALTMKPAYLSDVVGLPKNVARRLQRVLEELEVDPVRAGGHIKRLKGFKNYYRYRIDDHRLIYAVSPSARCIEILAIGLRRDVYDRLVRRPSLPTRPLPAVEAELEIEQPLPEETDPSADSVASTFEHDRLPDFTVGDLKAWRVPQQFHVPLLACRTDVDLYNAPLPAEWKDRVLDCLLPKTIAEVRSQPSLVLQSPEDMERFVEGELATFLLHLDADQGAIASRSLVGPALVKGGPGSGKSTVALYRVKSHIDASRGTGSTPTVLFTTYTNALTNVSEQLLGQLLRGRVYELDVRTTDSVIMNIYSSRIADDVRLASETQRRNALAAARSGQHGAADDLFAFLDGAAIGELSASYLLEEFDWVIEGLGLRTLDEYLAIARSGRGIGFDRSLRSMVWDLHRSWLEALDEQGVTTWGQVRLKALEMVESGQYTRRYDHVLIDEAQDLTPTSLRVCVALARSPAGIFLTADAGQSLYNRAFSWSRVHGDLRFTGRTRILKRNYRSTKQLGVAAADALGEAAGDPETLAQTYVREGPVPVLRAFDSRADQYTWLARELRNAARALQLSVAAAAVLCPTRKLAEEAAQQLQARGVDAEFVEGRALRLETSALKVMTMHSAKGLEFPVVALPALEEGVIPTRPEQGDDGEEHMRAQRRIFHVAVSRAMRILLLCTTAGSESPFVQALTPRYWDIHMEAATL